MVDKKRQPWDKRPNKPDKPVFGRDMVCRTCKGKGTDPHHPKNLCRNCGGTGILRKEQK